MQPAICHLPAFFTVYRTKNPPPVTDESLRKFSTTAAQLGNSNVNGAVFTPQYLLLEDKFAIDTTASSDKQLTYANTKPYFYVLRRLRSGSRQIDCNCFGIFNQF